MGVKEVLTRDQTTGLLNLPILNEYHVEYYGAVGDGVTNDGPAIQAAINAAELTGGYVVFEASTVYATTQTITCDADNVTLLCKAGSKYIFNQTQYGAQIKWLGTGSSPGPIIHMDCINPGGTFSSRAVGGGILGILANCGTATDHALVGIRLTSRAAGRYDIGVFNIRAGGVGLDLTTHPGAAAQAGDTQENLFERVQINVNGNHSGKCIRLTRGAAGSNVSSNNWINVIVQHGDGHGIDIEYSDSEFWNRVRGSRVAGSTTGRCMIFRRHSGGTTPARDQTIDFLQPGAGGIELEGGSPAEAAQDIHVLSYSMENLGARAVWGTNTKGIITYPDNGTIEHNGAALVLPTTPGTLALAGQLPAEARLVTETTRLNDDALSLFPDGISYQVAVTGDGWPANGIVQTIKDATLGTAVQLLRANGTGGTALRTRTWVAGASAWEGWQVHLRDLTTTKGDLMVRTATSFNRFAVGADNTVLVADSAATEGVKWAAPPIPTTAMGTVVHGATAATARPTGYTVVTWIGTVAPTNAVDGDIWIDQT